MRRPVAQLAGLAGGVMLGALLVGSYPDAPLSMTCAEFASLGETEQLRVMAWMNGYSRKGVSLTPAGERRRLLRDCRRAPEAPLREQMAHRF